MARTPNRIVVALGMVLLLVTVVSCASAPNTTSTTSQPTRTLLPAPADSGQDSLWGFIDTHGNWVIKPQFQGAMRFEEGLAPIKLGDLWGYVDQNGTAVIPPQYTEAHYFNNGLARVATRPAPDPTDHWLVTATGYGFIDKTGKWVIPAKWDDAGEFSDGLAPVMQGSVCGFIDTTGKVVIPLKFESVLSFSEAEGLAPAESDGKWGYISENGWWAIEPRYGTGDALTGIPDTAWSSPAGRFENGRAWVTVPYSRTFSDGSSESGSHQQCIKSSGEQAFEGAYDYVGDFSEGLAPVEVTDQSGDLQWSFIDPSGATVIKGQFFMSLDGLIMDGGGFHQGLAAVQIDSEVGYIDKTGKFVVPPQFAAGGGFSDGYAYVYGEKHPSLGAGVPSTLILQATRGLEIIDLTGRVIYQAPAASGSGSISSP